MVTARRGQFPRLLWVQPERGELRLTVQVVQIFIFGVVRGVSL